METNLSNNEETLFEGRTFEIIIKCFISGQKSSKVEIARRAPGVRLLIIKDNKMLIIREFRFELNAYDYRLPGGKVFDSLKEYKEALMKNPDILKHATDAAKKECIEETGLIVKKIKHYITSHAGLTVQWDLFYFIIDDFELNEKGQQLEHDEEIYVEWKTFGEVKELCLGNQVKEYRSVGVILTYLLQNKNK